ncbi:hypothetical protein KIN20_013562 [Parelaphostrongylus tenuis]|uniref:Uncharacterized protein n=1 Tax=Parelaphostrongylus tenuis TaxID=148309 RepID=A0AAD5QR42_PARTN|nr:hypothetical protein KIN20_013562 [Parelaphostrongylus tenuis]
MAVINGIAVTTNFLIYNTLQLFPAPQFYEPKCPGCKMRCSKAPVTFALLKCLFFVASPSYGCGTIPPGQGGTRLVNDAGVVLFVTVDRSLYGLLADVSVTPPSSERGRTLFSTVI